MRASSMKARYWSASARMEIFDRSTFCWRASVSSRSSGPSKPATSTISACSSEARSGDSAVSKSSAIIRSLAMMPANSSRAALDIERRRLAPRSERRIGAPRRVARQRRHRVRDRAHLVERAVAMEHDIAAGRERCAAALGERARQGLHRDVVGHQQSVEAKMLANHFAHHCAGSRGRRERVDRAKHNMRRHPQRKFRERPECGKIA